MGERGSRQLIICFSPSNGFLQLAHIWWWHSLVFRTIVMISRSTKWMFPVCFQPQGVARQNGAASRLILFRCLIFHLFVKTNRANTLHQSSQSSLCYFLLEMCSINRRFGSYSNLSSLSDFWQFGLPEVTLTQPSVSWYIRITQTTSNHKIPMMHICLSHNQDMKYLFTLLSVSWYGTPNSYGSHETPHETNLCGCVLI